MSNPNDDQFIPCSQMDRKVLKERHMYLQLLNRILNLQELLEDHFKQLVSMQLPCMLPEERKRLEVLFEQEKAISSSMYQMANVLWSKAIDQLRPKEPHISVNPRSDVTDGQKVLSPRQENQLVPQKRNFETESLSNVLSDRGLDIYFLYQSSFQDYDAYQKDKYHEKNNTLGFLNLGLAENKLCTDLIIERLCQSDMNYIEEVLLQYPKWNGQLFLREEVARFLTYYCKAPDHLDPENVVVLNGCCSVFSALAMVLCDPGEAFLVPAPFYGGFTFTSCLYSKVKLIPVYLESEITSGNTQPFQLTVDKLEQALREARHKRKKVKGLVLINPQNPLGDVYSRDSLMEYLKFAKRHNLHVIVDEIYMLSVFDKTIKFCSVLSIDCLPDPNKTHMIWGTSKDFGISGFRFGALYTHSREVATAVSSFGYLHSISGITQYKLYRLLQDKEWINKVYLPDNHSQLQKAHSYMTKKLESLKIPFLNRGAGLYIWINLKKFIYPCTFEEELALHRRFLDSKLMLSRGKSYMCKEPGWFRIIFAENSAKLQLAMQRFQEVLEEQKYNCIAKQLEEAQSE